MSRILCVHPFKYNKKGYISNYDYKLEFAVSVPQYYFSTRVTNGKAFFLHIYFQ